MYLLYVSGRTETQTALRNVSWQIRATELQGKAYLSHGSPDTPLPVERKNMGNVFARCVFAGDKDHVSTAIPENVFTEGAL